MTAKIEERFELGFFVIRLFEFILNSSSLKEGGSVVDRILPIVFKNNLLNPL